MGKTARISAALCALALAACQTLARPDFTLADLAAASPAIRHDSTSVPDRDRWLAQVRGAAENPADGAFDVLVLSGGGANGAYGAGVLVGWGERGNRPAFEVVNGVSIGALIAPFAFVGARDADLRAAFTDGRADGVLQARWAMALFGPGLYRTAPLRSLVETAIDDDLMARIAQGHRDGRRLYVSTTSLDTRDQVIWDLGAIATSGGPSARERMVDILTAAASVPGAFPPVLLDLERDGRRATEMHADGRATANLFLAPESVLRESLPIRVGGTALPGRVWVIVNGTPDETFGVAPYSGVSIATRSFEAMLNASTRVNLIAAAQYARLNGLALAITTPGDAGREQPLDFDRARMNALFEIGRERSASGTAWDAGPANAVNP